MVCSAAGAAWGGAAAPLSRRTEGGGAAADANFRRSKAGEEAGRTRLVRGEVISDKK